MLADLDSGAVRATDVAVDEALERFRMLEKVERVAVGVSGGADSMALLHSLARCLPARGVALVPVHIKQYPSQDAQALSDYVAESLDLDLQVIESDTTDVAAKSLAAGRGPCRDCSRKRARSLASAAHQLGAQAIALGHHLDDVAATLLMNMFHRGTVETMKPRVVRRGPHSIPVIRPLYFVPESQVKSASPLPSEGLFDCGMCTLHATERSRASAFVSEAFTAHPLSVAHVRALIERLV